GRECAVVAVLLEQPEDGGQLLGRVGDERERQATLLREARMAGLVLGADAEDLEAELAEGGVEVVERVRLDRAPAREVGRVEVDDRRALERSAEGLDREPVADVEARRRAHGAILRRLERMGRMRYGPGRGEVELLRAGGCGRRRGARSLRRGCE